MSYRSGFNINIIICSEDCLLTFAINKLLPEVKSKLENQRVDFTVTNVLSLNDVFFALQKQKCSSLILFDFDLFLFYEKTKLIELISQYYTRVKVIAICNEWDYRYSACYYNFFCDAVLKKNDAVNIYLAVIHQEIGFLIKKEIEIKEFNSEKESCHVLLSKRERDILKLIVKGKRNSEIASMLFISVKTVSAHRSNIFLKFKVRTIAGLYNAITEKRGISDYANH